MEVQRVSVPQSVQTQYKGYVVLQQTGVYGERDRQQGEVENINYNNMKRLTIILYTILI